MVPNRTNGHAPGLSLPLKKKLRRSSDSDESENGLLLNELDGVPTTPTKPRWAKQRLSRVSLKDKKTRWTLFAIIGVLILVGAGGAASVHRVRKNSNPQPPGSAPLVPPPLEEDVTIPLGQSRDDENHHEVFWWEQFERLHGYYHGISNIVSMKEYVPEQQSRDFSAGKRQLQMTAMTPAHENNRVACMLDEDRNITIPEVFAYRGVVQGLPLPLFGSGQEIGFDTGVCYDRISRFAPYGFGTFEEDGGLGIGLGDHSDTGNVTTTDFREIKWATAQERCVQKNAHRDRQRTVIMIRSWHTFDWNPFQIMMLRAMMSELVLASGGDYIFHFLIHVQDDNLPIWASEEVYNETLRNALPPEFEGMGTLWSVAQMRLVYPGPFPEAIENFSGGELYGAYRSLHFALQYWSYNHPEYDYIWQWELDLRVTGHYYDLLHSITRWAEKQPHEFAWERSANFFIPSLYRNSYNEYAQSVAAEGRASRGGPLSGPQMPEESLLPIPPQRLPETANEIVDLITFNPLFDANNTVWAFHSDITGYGDEFTRPPTRASLITVSRMSRRLLTLMHEETFRNKHTMFPEMYPASIAFHYGLKAVTAPLPLYMDREWPAAHANEVFNNAKLTQAHIDQGMYDRGGGYFQGEGGSVFGPGEHVFRGASYYSNALFGGYLWRRWLGRERGNDELGWEQGEGGGRMCLPMMVVHPVKFE